MSAPPQYLKLACPPLTREEKQRVSEELTAAMARAHADVARPERRRACVVHFCAFERDDLAIGGVLLSDLHRGYYLLEVSSVAPDQESKALLAREITGALARALDLGTSSLAQIHVVLRAVTADDVAVGGRLVSSLEPAPAPAPVTHPRLRRAPGAA